MTEEERGKVGADVLNQEVRPAKRGEQNGFSVLPVTLVWKITI